MNIKEKTYADFARKIGFSCGEKRILINVFFDLTYRCNLRCVHCYNKCSGHITELSTKDVKKVIDDIVDLGCLFLTFSGGEPFLRKDFGEIYVYAKNKGLIITIFSNATLLDKRMLDLLTEYRPCKFEVTVHSMDREVFDEFTGVRGSYNKCIRNIRALAQRQVRLVIKNVATTLNQSSSRGVYEFANSIGASFKYDCLLMKDFCNKKRISSLRIPLDVGLDEYNYFIAETKNQKNLKRADYCVGKKGVLTCLAGLNTLSITPSGNVKFCNISTYPSFSLKDESLNHIWNIRMPEYLRIRPPKDLKCLSCEYARYCENCIGWTQTEMDTQDFSIKPLEYLCEVAKARYAQEKRSL